MTWLPIETFPRIEDHKILLGGWENYERSGWTWEWREATVWKMGGYHGEEPDWWVVDFEGCRIDLSVWQFWSYPADPPPRPE